MRGSSFYYRLFFPSFLPMTELDPYQIIAHYYCPGTTAHRILVEHSECVARLALALADRYSDASIDRELI